MQDTGFISFSNQTGRMICGTLRSWGSRSYSLVSRAGAMDSMVNHYTAAKRRRSNDAYTPGNVSGFRPDYPSIVYTEALKQHFPDTPVVFGSVEASLRRLTHYDYWKDRLKPSMLIESGTDMILYGMGEEAVLDLAALLKKGIPISQINDLRQSVILRSKVETDQILGKKTSFSPFS